MSTDTLEPLRSRLHTARERLQLKPNTELVEGIGFALPYLVLFSVFLLYPLLRGLHMSMFAWNPFAPSESEFILFDNYIRMFEDAVFWTALKNTVYFVVLTVPTLVVLGLGLALGVNRGLKGNWFLQLIFFSPYLLTVSVASLIWAEMFNSEYGIVTYYTQLLFGSAPNWLNNPEFAMPAVAITSIWWTVGFNFVILLAARQSVPEELYEAARLDGANIWQAFRLVTVPQMRNSLLFVVIVQFIASFQIFGQVYVMTQGGPGRTTTTIVLYMYRAAFQNQELGYAAAIGYFLFAVLVVISIINFKFIGENNE